MALLAREDWHDLVRTTNWTPKYVTEAALFPGQMSGAIGMCRITPWNTRGGYIPSALKLTAGVFRSIPITTKVMSTSANCGRWNEILEQINRPGIVALRVRRHGAVECFPITLRVCESGLKPTEIIDVVFADS